MAKLGKRLTKAYENIDREKVYTVDEAIKVLKEAPKAKFDETVEIVMSLGVDPKYADQMVRGFVSMPNGTGKTIRVAVFAKGEKLEEAKKAGAELFGGEDLLEKIQAGEMGFERCIATPDMMGVVGRLGKVLGPRGLMPNPKLGTVTNEIAEAVKSAKSGQVQFKVEANGLVHAGIGKLSFSEDAIKQNVAAFVEAVIKAKPAGAKGTYVKKVSLSSTQGPGLKIALSSATA